MNSKFKIFLYPKPSKITKIRSYSQSIMIVSNILSALTRKIHAKIFIPLSINLLKNVENINTLNSRKNNNNH